MKDSIRVFVLIFAVGLCFWGSREAELEAEKHAKEAQKFRNESLDRQDAPPPVYDSQGRRIITELSPEDDPRAFRDRPANRDLRAKSDMAWAINSWLNRLSIGLRVAGFAALGLLMLIEVKRLMLTGYEPDPVPALQEEVKES